jgi:aminoglycoside 6'-N-acetyltransferase I
MQDSVETRLVAGPDFEQALHLLERFFVEEGFHADPGQVRRELRHLLSADDSAVFLAWLGDRPVGVATVTTTRGLELGLSAELEDLYVLPEARGVGAGAALIGTVKAWCRDRGCSLVAVVVTPEGQAAHDLLEYYGRRGFEHTGRTLLFARLRDDRSSEEGVF